MTTRKVFAQRFIVSSVAVMLFAWALVTHYYPFDFSIEDIWAKHSDGLEPSTLENIGAGFQVLSIPALGVGGLIATIACFCIVTGMGVDGRIANPVREAAHLGFLAPFAIAWLSMWNYDVWSDYQYHSRGALTVAVMLFAFPLLIIILGVLDKLFNTEPAT